jgi:hypothetical protein
VENVDSGRLKVPPLTGISGGIAGENVDCGRLKVCPAGAMAFVRTMMSAQGVCAFSPSLFFGGSAAKAGNVTEARVAAAINGRTGFILEM